MSPVSEIVNPENASQFKLVKDSCSNRVNDLLIHNTIPVTLYNDLLTFRDTGPEIELQGDHSKIKTNEIYDVELANSHERKTTCDFAKEMYIDEKAPGNKSTRDRSLIRLLKSAAIMASGIATKFLSSDPNDSCDKINVLLQEKQVVKKSIKFHEEIIAIAHKLPVYKCKSEKQHNILLVKSLNYMKKK